MKLRFAKSNYCLQKNSSLPLDKKQMQKDKLETKVSKVSSYWEKVSFFIPNVFRLVKKLDNETDNVFEFQDLSKKELLI